MATDVIMPKLGESITEGTILEWKKNVGDSVSRDETILEISTDKVDSEVPSPASGILLEILYDKNAVVAVGEVIARIGESGEKISSSSKSTDIEKTETSEKSDNNSIVRKETDKVSPLNTYAKTKIKGEKNISEINKNALIIRTNFFCWGPP